ncbi:MAG: hypothetical protein P8Y63_10585 [Deltaproteobacteria bacterium]
MSRAAQGPDTWGYARQPSRLAPTVMHGGQNGGRVCWAVSGTFCGGRVQGTFAQKIGNCLRCKFFESIHEEEGGGLLSVKEIRQQLKTNCWEYMSCGRELGGVRTAELGVCPAALEIRTDRLHNGQNGGRVCWAVSGTLCNGHIQGTFARKVGNCLRCDFYEQVHREEGSRLLSVEEIHSFFQNGCPCPPPGSISRLTFR